MIWSIAVMYFLIMVMRDFLVPLLYTELMNGPLKLPLEDFVSQQNYTMAALTYLTSLLFLGMYYFFAN